MVGAKTFHYVARYVVVAPVIGTDIRPEADAILILDAGLFEFRCGKFPALDVVGGGESNSEFQIVHLVSRLAV